jgi:cytidylate kinase
MQKYAKVIAIDGPSGSGKSTVARKVASELNLLYLDTGSMFRALAVITQKLNIDFTKDELTEDEKNSG